MQAPLFALLSQKSSWLAQRQAVLARNVANADTPAYVPHDVVPFEQHLRGAVGRLQPPGLHLTHAAHRPGPPQPAFGPARDRETGSYETAPSGNAVVLEEEVQKLASTRHEHELATELYGKYVKLVRHAMGHGS
jgi:flagellar basal-body rod protein FlgB